MVETGVPLSAVDDLVRGRKERLKRRDLQSVGQDYRRVEHAALTSTIFANAGTDSFSPPDGTPYGAGWRVVFSELQGSDKVPDDLRAGS